MSECASAFGRVVTESAFWAPAALLLRMGVTWMGRGRWRRWIGPRSNRCLVSQRPMKCHRVYRKLLTQCGLERSATAKPLGSQAL